jgi:hypothetical protein
MMADSWWDRVKDYAYRHAPGPVREWVDDSRAVARIRADMAERAEREQAFGEMENSKRWPHWNAGEPASHPDRDLALLREAHDAMRASELNPSNADLRQASLVMQERITHDAKAMEMMGDIPWGHRQGEGIFVDVDGSSDKLVYLKSAAIADVLRAHGMEISLQTAARQGVADWAIAQIQAQQARADENLSLFRGAVAGKTWAQEYAQGTGMAEPDWKAVDIEAAMAKHIYAQQEREEAFRKDHGFRDRDDAKGAPGMREGRDEELLRKYAEAIRRPGEIEIIPPTPKPTESVQYVEERRFHDKHNPAAREPIDLNRVRDERQRSWNWDR